jgi:hypothetical protein
MLDREARTGFSSYGSGGSSLYDSVRRVHNDDLGSIMPGTIVVTKSCYFACNSVNASKVVEASCREVKLTDRNLSAFRVLARYFNRT